MRLRPASLAAPFCPAHQPQMVTAWVNDPCHRAALRLSPEPLVCGVEHPGWHCGVRSRVTRGQSDTPASISLATPYTDAHTCAHAQTHTAWRSAVKDLIVQARRSAVFPRPSYPQASPPCPLLSTVVSVPVLRVRVTV